MVPALARAMLRAGVEVVLGAQPEAFAVRRSFGGLMLMPLLLPCRSSPAWPHCCGSRTWQPGATLSPSKSIMAY